ncbi:short neuropeptide F [Bacillus rossius redtenbacheri]|uniref:short neuropeptide F n=1 Tax=Bacillus rossius redtenbacheri TaxID=93214 RepID=UPI002FDD70B1
MQAAPMMKSCCTLLLLMLLVTHMSASPPSYDYENMRDLYELLLQKEALEGRLGQHQVVRKANRSPSLRLRFGRRSDPELAATFPEHASFEAVPDN